MELVRKLGSVLLLFLWLASFAAGAQAGGSAGGSSKVNVNTASEAELVSLPGIGPAKARAIVEYRERTPFKSVDDLKLVSGLGDHTVETIRDRVTVGKGR